MQYPLTRPKLCISIDVNLNEWALKRKKNHGAIQYCIDGSNCLESWSKNLVIRDFTVRRS
jgi:hypothetical protein